MKKIFALLAFLLLLTAGCAPNYKSDNKLITVGQLKSNDSSESITTAETSEDDFIYRLVSEKGIYENGEEVKLYAELEYIGAEDHVTISHAASPFFFPMHEQTRNYEITYGMNEPLIRTTIEKGKPLREEYGKSGGFDSKDDKEYIKFMKEFTNVGFPEGHYFVNGIADFFVSNDEGTEMRDYRMEAIVDFLVKD